MKVTKKPASSRNALAVRQAAVRRKRPGSYHHGDLKRALMDAALELVAARGPAGLKLAEVCRAAGVSQAAFYRHFETREQLLAELVMEGFQELTAMTLREFARPRAAVAAVHAGARAYLAFARDHAAHLRLMFSRPIGTEGEFAGDPRTLKDFFAGKPCPLLEHAADATGAAYAAAAQAGDAAFQALIGGFAGIAAREGKSCPWKPADASAVGLGFWAIVHGVAVLSLEGQLGSDPWGKFNERYLRAWLLDPWLSGLAAASGAHHSKKS